LHISYFLTKLHIQLSLSRYITERNFFFFKQYHTMYSLFNICVLELSLSSNQHILMGYQMYHSDILQRSPVSPISIAKYRHPKEKRFTKRCKENVFLFIRTKKLLICFVIGAQHWLVPLPYSWVWSMKYVTSVEAQSYIYKDVNVLWVNTTF